MIGEDEDLVEWERVVRDYLNQLPNGRHNRVTGILIWEWATGKSTSEAHKKGESTLYLRDIRRINKILRSYFGDSRQTFINGRKFSRVFDMRKGFIVDRKAPHCLSLYLEWKRGAKVR